MVHIGKVHIKEFRGLRDCTVTFGECNQPPHKFNMFVGANSSGKTSFIDSIIEAKKSPTNNNIDVRWTWFEEARQTVYFSSDRRQKPVDGVQVSPVESARACIEIDRIRRFVTMTLRQQTRRMGRRHSEGTSDRDWLARLNSFWTQFRKNETTIDMDIVDHKDVDNTDWNLFLFKGDERICSVDCLSAGEIDAIAFAVPFITMPIPFHGVVLIDDVEAYMTQEWATSLLMALRTMLPEAQFVVTTRLKGWTLPDCAMYDMGAITSKA